MAAETEARVCVVNPLAAHFNFTPHYPEMERRLSDAIRPTWRTLLERDLDLTLLDLLHTSTEFSDWLFNRTLGREMPGGAAFTAAWHSVVGPEGRESDLEAEWVVRNGSRARLLIEDKIDAACQPDQALSYKHRAARYVQEGAASHCATVLIAPREYPERHKEDTALFDYFLSLESIREWIESEPGLKSRAPYLADFLSAIVNKFQRARQSQARTSAERNGSVSKPLYPALYDIIRTELSGSFPQLGINNSTPGEWVYFSFPGKGRGVSIRYRARDHWVELVLPRKSFDHDVVTTVHREHPLPGSRIAQRGQTELAIWIPSEEIDLDTDLELQRDRIRGALVAVADLAAWFRDNIVRLTPSRVS